VGQALGASEIIHSTAIVDQVGSGREREHVLVAQIVTVAPKHILSLLSRLPVVSGLP